MKTWFFGFAAIVVLQACSNAPTSEVNEVQNFGGVCETKVYKWTDEEGTVHYGDSLPADSSNKPNPPDSGQVDMPQCEGGDELALEEFARARENPRREESFRAQMRVTELYLQNLQNRLAHLEDAVDATKDNESLLNEIRETKQEIARLQPWVLRNGKDPSLSTH